MNTRRIMRLWKLWDTRHPLLGMLVKSYGGKAAASGLPTVQGAVASGIAACL